MAAASFVPMTVRVRAEITDGLIRASMERKLNNERVATQQETVLPHRFFRVKGQ